MFEKILGKKVFSAADRDIQQFSAALIRKFCAAALKTTTPQDGARARLAGRMRIHPSRFSQVINPREGDMPGIVLMVKLAVAQGGVMQIRAGKYSLELDNPKKAAETIRKFVINMRKAAQLREKDMARRTHMKIGNYKYIEKERRPRGIRFSTFVRICMATGHVPEISFKPRLNRAQL